MLSFIELISEYELKLESEWKKLLKAAQHLFCNTGNCKASINNFTMCFKIKTKGQSLP